MNASSSRLRWIAHLCILSLYLFVGVLIRAVRGTGNQPHIPLDNVHRLLAAVGLTVSIFALVSLLAWLCSRSTAAEWRLSWKGNAGPVWRGFVYAIGIRITLFVVIAVPIIALTLLHVMNPESVKAFRPHPENAISPQALANDPTFRWLAVGLLSTMAGVLEEIWRGGMLAALAGVFPQIFGSRRGQFLAVLPVAVVFGMAHLYMGWAGVIGAGVLGIVLGVITVWYGTIWDAVFTHIFFDAGSFAGMAWMAMHYPQAFGG